MLSKPFTPPSKLQDGIQNLKYKKGIPACLRETCAFQPSIQAPSKTHFDMVQAGHHLVYLNLDD